jgi:hypothetical protein
MLNIFNQNRLPDFPKDYQFRGCLDEPLREGYGSKCSGWFLSKKDIHKAALYIDDEMIMEIKRNKPRKDVAAVFPEYPCADKCGFEYAIPLSAARKFAEEKRDMVLRFYIDESHYVERFKTRFYFHVFSLHKIPREENLLINSKPIKILPNHKYKLNVPITALKGRPFSAYCAVMIRNSNNKEIARFIRWISDFSGEEKNYSIVFTAPDEASYAVIGCRVNYETTMNSDFEMIIPELSSVELQETNVDNETFDGKNIVVHYSMPQLPELSKEDKKILEGKIVWVFGFQRSGTTWLSNRLLNHKDNISWLEPNIGQIFACNFEYFDYKSRKHVRKRRVDAFEDYKYFFAPQHKKNWLPALKDLILMRAYSQVQSLSHNIIIKEVNATGIDILMECFPKTKLCFLLRDGRDCVESTLDSHGEGSWSKSKPVTSPQERLKLISNYSSLWVDFIEAVNTAFLLHDPSMRILVRYEDLRDNTLAELKKVYDLIGINASDNDLKRIIEAHDFKNIPDSRKGPGKFNRAAKTGGWKNTFNKNEIDIMNSIMGDTLKQFGYEL